MAGLVPVTNVNGAAPATAAQAAYPTLETQNPIAYMQQNATDPAVQAANALGFATPELEAEYYANNASTTANAPPGTDLNTWSITGGADNEGPDATGTPVSGTFDAEGNPVAPGTAGALTYNGGSIVVPPTSAPNTGTVGNSPGPSTTTTVAPPDSDDSSVISALANLLAGSGSSDGSGADSTVPSDVDALNAAAPTFTGAPATSTSSPNVEAIAIAGVVAIGGIGFYLYHRWKAKHGGAPPPAPAQ